MIRNSDRDRSRQWEAILVPSLAMPFLATLTVALTPLPLFARETTVIEFPEEELASESVLPVFPELSTVRDRNVVTDGRFELGVMGGQSLTEPVFNPWNAGITATYHFTEEHAVNLFTTFFFQGLSSNGENLHSIETTNGSTTELRPEYAPAPKYLGLANYQFTAFYGKISLSKATVMNLSLYGLAGGGMIAIGDVTKPVVNIGLGQKFYFNSSFALRFDLRLAAYQGPNPLSIPLTSDVTADVPASEFEERLNLMSLLSVGAVWLL